jgi:hypothetical protein
MLTQRRSVDFIGLHWLPALLTAAQPPDTTHLTEASARELVEDFVNRFVAAMSGRYGPRWATGSDLPDEAYLAEQLFAEQLSNLRDDLDRRLGAPPQ